MLIALYLKMKAVYDDKVLPLISLINTELLLVETAIRVNFSAVKDV